MKMKNSLKLVLFWAFFVMNCKNIPQKSSSITEDQLFYYKTSECMGTCPVFTFTIFPDGSCTYQGVANVDNLGTFSGTINKEELSQFKSTLSESKFYDINIESNSLVKDLPTTYLFYNDGNQQKTITYYDASNKKVEGIINQANGLIESIKWTKK